MDIRHAFPSKYLRASDITGPTTYTVKAVRMEQLNGETKAVVDWRETGQSLVVNRSNADRLAATLGYDTTAWIGRQVTLDTVRVPFRGQMVDSIQVQLPQPQEMPVVVRVAHPHPTAAVPAQPARPAQVVPRGGLDDELNDEIPF